MPESPLQQQNIKPPVSVSLSKNRLRDVLQYMKGLRQDNRVLAQIETERLKDYFEAFHDLLLADAKKYGLAEDQLQKIDERKLSKRIFNRIAERTGNTILSEFTVLPEQIVKNAIRQQGFPVFVKTTKYNGLNITFGFTQIFELEDPDNPRSARKSSNSISLIGIDDDIAAIMAKYNPSALLRALQDVASAANHDMQHHITSETINPMISQKSDIHHEGKKYPEKSRAGDWSDSGFGGSGDEDIKSYESFMILNHARVWREWAGSEREKQLEQSCMKFCDQLDRISVKMQAENAIYTSEAIDYMGMLLCNCLFRFLPLDHPLMDKVMERIKDAVPNAEEHMLTDFRELQKRKWEGQIPQATYLQDTIKNYAAAGYDMRQTDLLQNPDYIKIKKWQLAAISPEIAYLNSPARAGTQLDQVQRRTSSYNFLMMQALSVDAADVIPNEPVHFNKRDGGHSILYFNDDGDLHREGAPAMVSYDKDGNKTEEQWMRKGQFFRDDGPAGIVYYSNGQIRSAEYCNEKGEKHRDDKPASVEYYEDGNVKTERWYINGQFERGSKPAIVSYFNDGQIESERWYQNGMNQNGDKPAEVWYYPEGNIRIETWKNEGREAREDDKPSCREYAKNGDLIKETYITLFRRDHRSNGPSEYYVHPDTGNVSFEYCYQNNFFGRATVDKSGKVQDEYWTDIVGEENEILEKFQKDFKKRVADIKKAATASAKPVKAKTKSLKM